MGKVTSLDINVRDNGYTLSYRTEGISTKYFDEVYESKCELVNKTIELLSKLAGREE